MDIRLIDLVELEEAARAECQAGRQDLIITDTKMDPVLWHALAAAANSMDIEPAIAIMTPRAAHSMDPSAQFARRHSTQAPIFAST